MLALMLVVVTMSKEQPVEESQAIDSKEELGSE